ncbi:unnamed protein product [Closterium sp. Naga37s-1]|nr:unnamed protein product [Closterium sp. Naga37s-1]
MTQKLPAPAVKCEGREGSGGGDGGSGGGCAEDVAVVFITAAENAAARIDDADVASEAIREPPTAGSASPPTSMSIRAVSRRGSQSSPQNVTRGGQSGQSEQQRRKKSSRTEKSKKVVPKVQLASQSERRGLMTGTLSTGKRPVLPRGAMQLVVDPYNLWGSRVDARKVPLKPFVVRYGDTLAALAVQVGAMGCNGMQVVLDGWRRFLFAGAAFTGDACRQSQ